MKDKTIGVGYEGSRVLSVSLANPHVILKSFQEKAGECPSLFFFFLPADFFRRSQAASVAILRSALFVERFSLGASWASRRAQSSRSELARSYHQMQAIPRQSLLESRGRHCYAIMWFLGRFHSSGKRLSGTHCRDLVRRAARLPPPPKKQARPNR